MAQVYLGNNLLLDGSTHSDQVIAAAFVDLEERVETLEAGGGGSGGGSSFDPTNINSSISDISTRVQTIESNYLDSDDISTFVDIDDVSAFTYSKALIDASFAGLDASMNYIYDYAADVSARVGSGGGGGGSTPDLTNYATKSDISTFKPIQYVNLSTYEENVSDGTIDQDTMYVITDLADSDELATLVTVDDLSTYRQNILDDVSTYADTVITNANTSINSIKTTAISAVQSQQTTSVNAVNTAKNNANTSIGNAKTQAISDISTAAATITANMKEFVVLSESDYEQISVPDSNTIYFITD